MGPKYLTTVFILFWYFTVAIAIESNFYREESCASKHGFCVLESECPGALTNEQKDLCPSQKASGGVCCPHVKQEETNCFQLHNDCRESCPTALTLGKKGCPDKSVCCVLI